MAYKITKVFRFCGLLLFLSHCKSDPDFPVEETQGYLPVYTVSAPLTITSDFPISTPGKILKYKNYLLIYENNLGVHILDDSDPTQPTSVGFIPASSNSSMFLDNGRLVMDVVNDIVVVDLDDLNDIQVARKEIWPITVPPFEGHYFECVDPSRGEVTSWTTGSIKNPTCYR